MKTIIKQCFFPDSECEVLHQNGVRIGEPSKGVEITLYSQENGTEPCSAELIRDCRVGISPSTHGFG
jgi:hypothetical protein